MSKKTLNIIAIILMVLSVAIGIYTFVRCNGLNAKVDKAQMMDVIEPMFDWMYVLLIVALAALIIMPIPHLLKNPAGMKKLGFGVIAMGALFLLAYLFSSDAPLPFIEEAARKNESSRLADINIIAIYIMATVAVVAVVGTAIRGVISPNK